MTQGGPTIPVAVSSANATGEPALRVTGYATTPAGTEGGPARPVVLISEAQVAAGYPVQANAPVPMAVVSDGRPALGGPAQPVYVVSGLLPTYYVDATGGSDSANGRTASTAWKTIAKVNAATLRSGDVVALKRGETYTGTRLVIAVDGVTVGAYGSGAKPIIDGGTVFSPFAAGVDCILLSGARRNITIRDLHLKNGNDYGISMDGCNTIRIIDVDVTDIGNDGVLATNSVSVHVYGGTFQGAKNRTGTYVSAGIEFADGGTGHLIDGATLTGNATTGIAVHNHASTDPQGRTDVPANVLIRNVTSTANTGSGIQLLTNDTTTPFNIVVEDSTFSANGTYDLNLTKKAGATNYPEGVTVRRCTLDGGTGASNIAVQLQGTTILFHNNLVKLAADKQIAIANAATMGVYNNTIYQASNTSFRAMLGISGTTNSALNVKNNLFITDDTDSYQIAVATNAGTGLTSDYNFFDTQVAQASSRWTWSGVNYNFANFKSNSSQDAHSTAYTRAQVVSVGSDFHLQASSPCINAGVNVGLPYSGSAPDIGAYEKA